MKRHNIKNLAGRIPGLCLLIAAAAGLLPAAAQASRYTARADYANRFDLLENNGTSVVFSGGHQGTPNNHGGTYNLAASSFGQPVSRSIASFTYRNDLIQTVLGMLYYEYAGKAGLLPEEAAFRYKNKLYTAEASATQFKRNQLDLLTMWGDAEKQRAEEAAELLKEAIRFMPNDAGLRWVLLDIYYDTALANQILANEKRAQAYEVALGENSSVTNQYPNAGSGFQINTEIAILEDARALYKSASSGYFSLLLDPLGVDVATLSPVSGNKPVPPSPENKPGPPFGFYLFQQEVPRRSLYLPPVQENGNWIVPPVPLPDDNIDENHAIFSGYKDLVLLFKILRDTNSVTADLAKLYIMRGQPGDRQKALELCREGQQASLLEGRTVLKMFQLENAGQGFSQDSPHLKDEVLGWQYEISRLQQLHAYAKNGGSLMGMPDDFFVLYSVASQSIDPDLAKGPTVIKMLNTLESSNSILAVALKDLQAARASSKELRERQDAVKTTLHGIYEQYDERLRQIVGVKPGEPGYNDPFGNKKGGELELLALNIKRAQKRIEANGVTIDNLNRQIEFELSRHNSEMSVREYMGKLHYQYGNIQQGLTGGIGAINANQAYSKGMAGMAAWDKTSPWGWAATASDAAVQLACEIGKAVLQSQKEKYATELTMKLLDAEGKIVAGRSAQQIHAMRLQQRALAIESAELALQAQQEQTRLVGLQNEKAALERAKDRKIGQLAQSYHADPSHRLMKDAAFLKAERSFAAAHKDVFLAQRALEYCWNMELDGLEGKYGRIYGHRTIEGLRNAEELQDMVMAMRKLHTLNNASYGLDDDYQEISLKDDILGYKGTTDAEGMYPDPLTGEQVNGRQAFKSYLRQPQLQKLDKNGMPWLCIPFSTARRLGRMFIEDRFLEKIVSVKVRMLATVSGTADKALQGYLHYGGTSWVRTSKYGTEAPGDPTRLQGEMRSYPATKWMFEKGKWVPNESLGASINIELKSSADPLSTKSLQFYERSVAATGWVLEIPVKIGTSVTVAEIDDIKFDFYYTYRSRQKTPLVRALRTVQDAAQGVMKSVQGWFDGK